MFTNNFRKHIEVKCPNSFKVLKIVLKLFVYFTSVCFFKSCLWTWVWSSL